MGFVTSAVGCCDTDDTLLMEEENYSLAPALSRQSYPIWLAIAALLILLTACQTPAPESSEDTTRLPSSGATMTSPPATEVVTSPPEPTPLPVIRFMGIEFGYDEQTFGPLLTKAHHPPLSGIDEPPQPEHLQFSMVDSDTLDAPQLLIYPVNQYMALSPAAAQQIDYLRELLQDRPADPLGPLPMLPLIDAVATFHTPPNYFDFRNGSGLSFVVRADHDNSLQTAETLYFTYQGLTANGRFYVAAFFPLAEEDIENGTLKPYTAPADDEPQKTPAEAKWSGLPAGVGIPAVETMLATLLVDPEAGFPHSELPAFAQAPGVLMAYDPAVAGDSTLQRLPAVVNSDDGAAHYLPGVPDIISLQFGQEAQLTIQPVRDALGAFFAAIPTWQRDQVTELEDRLTSGASDGQMMMSFVTGEGLRWITEAANSPDVAATYHFQGLSNDGRYLVNMAYPLDNGAEANRPAPSADLLDSMIGSLVIDPDASIQSSVPQDQDGCQNGAEFITDVSVPDRTIVERGETFVKVWRVRNSGTCTWTPAYHVDYAQGNPVPWQPLPLTTVVAPGGETEVAMSLTSPEVPGIYQAYFQLADPQGTRFGDKLSVLFEAPKPATDIPGHGMIEGAISYPAASNPAIDIYFLNTGNGDRFAMRTEKGWTRFANAIPSGTYQVFARVAGDESQSGGGYTQAVICGLHADCTDHSLVEVIVEEGKAHKNVDLFDWYAPEGSFPFPDVD